MNRPELYHKTVDILKDAYFNDTLEHSDYCACAVGNLVAANMGYEMVNEFCGYKWKGVAEVLNGQQWYKLVNKGFPFDEHFNEPIAKAQIRSTGYSVEDVIEIERAFENADSGESEDEYMFNGLMAVIDVLDEIHGNKDENVTTATKQKFHKSTV